MEDAQVPPTYPVAKEVNQQGPVGGIVGRSPIPNKKPLELSFPDAMREVINGRRITRLEWETNDVFGKLEGGFLSIFIRGKYEQWIVNDGDLLAIDWVVLPELN